MKSHAKYKSKREIVDHQYQFDFILCPMSKGKEYE